MRKLDIVKPDRGERFGIASKGGTAMRRFSSLVTAVFLLIVLLLLPANVFVIYRWFCPEHEKIKSEKLSGIYPEVLPGEEIIAVEPCEQTEDGQGKIFFYTTPQGLIHCSSGGSLVFGLGSEVLDVKFDWIDRFDGYILKYDRITAADYNKDLIFDHMRNGDEYGIVVNGKYIALENTDFSIKGVKTIDGRCFDWTGDSWQEKLPGDK
ncbi:MAG: hypothetical protein E7047_01005 [Lentisphaerae bacterium]|nr:hypothetical protein [Lentisphaerota bacterium]